MHERVDREFLIQTNITFMGEVANRHERRPAPSRGVSHASEGCAKGRKVKKVLENVYEFAFDVLIVQKVL